MVLTPSDYEGQLARLLPHGPAWPTEPGTATMETVGGMAEEFARADARIGQLVNEADPRTTYELLADWERVCGLPTVCMAGIDQTIAQRQAALVARLTDIGGQRPVDYIALAASVGYAITITEFQPHSVGMAVNHPIYHHDWAYAFQVNGDLLTRTWHSVGGAVSEPLSAWGNELLECVILGKSPAHTEVIFSYT